MQKFEEWEKKARNEFKYGEFYEKSIGDNFEVSEEGNVYLDNMHVIKKAVTPYKDFIFQ